LLGLIARKKSIGCEKATRAPVIPEDPAISVASTTYEGS